MSSEGHRRDGDVALLTPADFHIDLLFTRLRDAVIVVDAASHRILLWSPAAEGLFGYTATEAAALTVEMLLPEHARSRHIEAIARYAATGQTPIVEGDRSVEVPAHTKSGRVRIVEVTLSALDNETAAGRCVLAIVHDISERRRSQRAVRRAQDIYRDIVENAAEGIYQTTPDGRILTANPALARILGYDSPRALIDGLTDIARQFYVDPDRRQEFITLVARHGRVTGFESQVYCVDGSIIWVQETARAVLDQQGQLQCYEGTVQDITARRQATEEQTARVAAEIEQRRLAFLAEASDLLTASLDYGETLQRVARLAIPFLADGCAIDIIEEDGALRRIAVASADPAREALARELAERYPIRRDAAAGVAHVLRTGQAAIYNDDAQAVWEATAYDPEHLALLRRLGTTSRMIVPLTARGQTLGAISFGLTGAERRYGPADLALAEEVARRAALAIDNARLYDSLALSEQRFRAFVQNAADVIVVLESDGTIRYASPPLARVLGYDPDAIIGRRPTALVHEDDASIVQSTIRAAIAQPREHQSRELRIRHRDGTWRTLEVTASNLIAEPAVRGVVINLHDITERKAIEEEQRFLAEAGAVLATSLEYDATLARLLALTVPRLGDWCAIDRVEPDGMIRRIAVTASDPALEHVLTELSARYPPGLSSDHPIAVVLRTGVPLLSPDAAELLERLAVDDQHLALNRALRTTSRMTVPLIAHGRRLGAISFGYTEPDRRHTSHDLVLGQEFAERAALAIDNARLYHEAQAALVEATEALSLRDQFLSVASHELRTPLTALKGQIQLAQRRLAHGQVDRVMMLIEHADGQVDRLTRLVRDLLDVSRIQAGGFHIDPEPVALGALVQRAVEMERAAVPERQFTLHLPETIPPVLADEERLEQVLINLLENARKYSPATAPIKIEVRVVDTSVAVSVTDRGVGIPAADQARIFDRFHRAGNVDHNIAGLGLGLYIAGEIVKAHDGNLSVRSAPGEGSTFTVALPLGQPPREQDQ